MARTLMRRSGFFVTVVIFITGCASIHETDRATYYDSALNDHNRAPASLAPRDLLSDGGQATIDPVYMQTQADYYFSMGEAQSLEGNRQHAVESFKMALVYDAGSVAVRTRLATEYLKIGMMSEALDQAEQAVKLSPKNVDARLLLGGLYSTMKLYEKAVSEYEEVLKQNPNNPEAPLYLGAVYSELKQYDKAVRQFEVLAHNPDYQTPYMAYYYVGRVRSEQKELKYQKAAQAAYQRCLEIKPDFVDGVIALSALFNKKGQETKAISILTTFQKERGPSPRIAEMLSQYFIEKGKYDEAYEQFEVLETNSDDVLNVKLKMALILIEKKIYDRAVAKLEEILKEAPDSDKIRFYLGAVYEESKQEDKAISNFKKIPPKSQYYAEAVIHAAYLLKNKGKLDVAIESIEEALKDKKDSPQIYAMYASLLDEKGDIKKSLTALEEAIKQFPANAQLRFYYGTVHDRLGDKDQVVEQMKKVIEIDPNHVQGLNYLAFTWAEDNKNLEEAEKLAKRAMNLDPKDGYVLDTLGWILYKQNKGPEAIKYLEAAHRHQPTVGVIAEHLGDAYFKLSMVEKAVGMYNKALELETDRKKIDEIKAKITSIENQRLQDRRMPATADHK